MPTVTYEVPRSAANFFTKVRFCRKILLQNCNTAVNMLSVLRRRETNIHRTGMTVAIDPKLHTELKVRAARNRVHLTDLINRALKAYLDKNPLDELNHNKES